MNNDQIKGHLEEPEVIMKGTLSFNGFQDEILEKN